MKLKNLILMVGLSVPLLSAGQPASMGSSAPAFLERGRLMLDARNYCGTLDQTGRSLELPEGDLTAEQAELQQALASFELGHASSLGQLIAFVEAHPTSPLAQTAQLCIGNYYFYRGLWSEALLSYSLVRQRSLDLDSDEDLRYREAYCHLRLGELADAQTLYQRLSDSKRYSGAVVFYRAYIDYAEGRYNDAQQRFASIDPSTELGYQSQYYITQIKYSRGQFSDVIATGRQLLAEENNDYFSAELARMVGESYFHTGDYSNAKTYLRRYFENPEGDIYRTAAYAQGVLDWRDGNYAGTAAMMPLATDGSDALAQSAWLYLGQARLKQDDLVGAARAFEQAASMSADKKVRETAFYNYAITQHKGARTPFGRSIDLFEQFLNDYPNSRYKDQVEGYLTDTYLTGSDYEKALESINRIKQPGKKVLRAKQHVLYNLGVQSLQSGQTDRAVTLLQQAVDLGSLDASTLNESRLWLAEAQYRAGNYSASASQQQAYVKAAGSGSDNYGLAQYNLGYSLFQQRRYAQARTAFENALKSRQLAPDVSADTYNRIADTYYYEGDFGSARKNYDAAIAADRQAAQDYAMYQKGMMLGLSKQYAEQAEQMEALVAAYPKSSYAPAALLEKAVAQGAQGDVAGSLATYDRLLKVYPKSAEARKGLLQKAVAQREAGKETAAIDTYKRVIKDYPTSEEAGVAAGDLKLIMADRGELAQFGKFLSSVPNGPRLDVGEVDRLTFEAAEKAAIAETPDISRMEQYLKQNPDGAYSAKAQYYIARHAYQQGRYEEALSGLDKALKGGSDAGFAEDAMAMRSDILLRQGKAEQALAAYKALSEKSSSADNRLVAELGVMRSAMQLERWSQVASTCGDLLGMSGLTASEEREVKLDRALALTHLGRNNEAESVLKSLASEPQHVEGAQAAVVLAEMQLSAGNLKAAERTADALADSGTPHSYWLARGFLVLSDVYVKQGRTGDARDYLQSLKNNYPGKEADIREGIDRRLAALSAGKTTGKQAASSDNKSGKNSKKKSK